MHRLSITMNALRQRARTAQQFCVLALAFAFVTTLAALPVLAEEFSGKVTRVTDGDTFRMSGIEPAIRVWGLDAPEQD